MKRTFALLLSGLLALSLTACGKDDPVPPANSGSASVTDNGGVLDGGAGSGVTTNDGLVNEATGSGDRVDNGAPGTDAGAADNDMLGLENDGVGAPDSSLNTGSTAVPQSGSMIRGATYGQMLRNGSVHDQDGYLRDGENAVTPGTAYR